MKHKHKPFGAEDYDLVADVRLNFCSNCAHRVKKVLYGHHLYHCENCKKFWAIEVNDVTDKVPKGMRDEFNQE